jgi:hypothetical protein
MSRDVLIEAMVRWIDPNAVLRHSARQSGKLVSGPGSWVKQDAARYATAMNRARNALDALRTARPDIADVLDGKAVVVPVEISKDDAEGIWETAYDVWAEFGATDADAGREAHRAALAASPYRSAK